MRREFWFFFSVWQQTMDKRKMAKFNLRFRKITKTKQKRSVNRTVFLFTLLLLNNPLSISRNLIKHTYQPKLMKILEKKKRKRDNPISYVYKNIL